MKPRSAMSASSAGSRTGRSATTNHALVQLERQQLAALQQVGSQPCGIRPAPDRPPPSTGTNGCHRRQQQSLRVNPVDCNWLHIALDGHDGRSFSSVVWLARYPCARSTVCRGGSTTAAARNRSRGHFRSRYRGNNALGCHGYKPVAFQCVCSICQHYRATARSEIVRSIPDLRSVVATDAADEASIAWFSFPASPAVLGSPSMTQPRI